MTIRPDQIRLLHDDGSYTSFIMMIVMLPVLQYLCCYSILMLADNQPMILIRMISNGDQQTKRL